MQTQHTKPDQHGKNLSPILLNETPLVELLKSLAVSPGDALIKLSFRLVKRRAALHHKWFGNIEDALPINDSPFGPSQQDSSQYLAQLPQTFCVDAVGKRAMLFIK